MKDKLSIANDPLNANMMLETITDFSGDLKEQKKWREVSCYKTRGGWRKVYMDIFKIFRVCVSSLENRMAEYIMLEIKKGFTIDITYKKLMSKFNVSDKKAKTFLKKMKDVELLYLPEGVRGHYKTNPFMYIPYGSKDNEIYDAQVEWTQIMEKKGS